MTINQRTELERFMEVGLEKGATEILLVPGEPAGFRVRGIIQRESGEPLTSRRVTEIASAALGEDDLKRIGREVGEIRTRCSLGGKAEGRICVAKSMGEHTIAIQIFPREVPDARSIGIPEALLEAALGEPGLIIVAGPTGSGKTTTLIALAEYIGNSRSCHICTVEDPVHYVLRAEKAIVQQREVGIDVPHTVGGIMASLRQDPDVLVVTEVRDAEEVKACFGAVENGCMVLLQMHGVSKGAAIQRLMDLHSEEKIEIYQRRLAESLRAASVQILLPKATGEGRVAAYGLLIPDKATRVAIAEGYGVLEMVMPEVEGCRTLVEDIGRLFREGIISAETRDKALGELE